MVTLRFFKVHFTLNLPIDWSWYLSFDPDLGSGSIVHVLFGPIFTIVSAHIRNFFLPPLHIEDRLSAHIRNFYLSLAASFLY